MIKRIFSYYWLIPASLIVCCSAMALQACSTPRATALKKNQTIPLDTIPEIHPYSSLYEIPDLKGVPIMHFDKRMVALGTVKKGEKRTFSYDFVNRGDTPLSIAIVTACECTTTDYPQFETIEPGKGGSINIVFDSSEKDAGELIDIEILLDQTMPGTDIPIIEKLYYDFEIIE